MGNPQQSWQGWESLRKEVALDVSLGHGSSPTPQGKSGLGHGQWEQGLLQLFRLQSLGLSTSGLSLPPAPPGISILSSIASVHVGRKTTRVFFFHCKHFLLILHFHCVRGLNLHLPKMENLGIWMPVLEASFV